MTVIHRFMAAHSTIGQTGADAHIAPEMRLDPSAYRRMRHASEHSEVYSEVSEGGGGGGAGGSGGSGRPPFGGSLCTFQYPTVKRKGPVRSMTEVRPSVTSESFLMMDTIRTLRESREPSPLTAGDVNGSKRSSLIEENDNLLVAEVSYAAPYRGQLTGHAYAGVTRMTGLCILFQRKTPERQKTSFSLDGEDVTLTENMMADVGIRPTSGSLGCLDSYSASNVAGEMEPGDGQARRGSNSSADDAPSSRVTLGERTVTWAEPRIKVIPPNASRSTLMAMHTEYTR